MPRIVLFLDLDYFFAQVEEVENPELRGKPLCVCVFSGRTSDSGVVSSANYVARRFGVKAGMPIKAAKKLLPEESVILPVRLEHYATVSRQIMENLKKFNTPLRVESIDEAVMDITQAVGGDYIEAEKFAKKVKEIIRANFGLTCSVGVGPNRVLAKMAADYSKPDGLTVVKPEKVEEFLRDLPVKNLPGIGAKTERLLAEHQIKTIGDLSRQSLEKLEELFGPKKAHYLYLASRGIYDEVIEERPPPKQLSKIVTLKRNTREVEEVMETLAAATSEAYSRLASSKFFASKIGLIAITTRLETITRQADIRLGATLDEVLRSLRLLLTKLLETDEKLMLRRVGVRFSGLKPVSGQTSLNIFSEG
ncbi:MAG: DNA polymerase IV [Candidatus Caldarchaeum sp.]